MYGRENCRQIMNKDSDKAENPVVEKAERLYCQRCSNASCSPARYVRKTSKRPLAAQSLPHNVSQFIPQY